MLGANNEGPQVPEGEADRFNWSIILLISGWIIALVIQWNSKDGVSNWFDAFAALVAGMAFLLTFATLTLQRLELRANTKELSDQANALHNQVKVTRLSALLAAIPVLIRQEQDRLLAWHPHVFGEHQQDLSINGYEQTLSHHLSEVAKLDERIARQEERIEELRGNSSLMVDQYIEGLKGHRAHKKQMQSIADGAQRLIDLTNQLNQVHRELVTLAEDPAD
ncbi:hypothetical protein [Verrucomicrobium spinosum]|uniref:hypothetical protein n=1 Tax=Verrucomicrobium spinosum TaxID=2736 RepID=UPI0001744710|nr:hypothetical protein [Verrucomicrobium spinosum]